MEEKEQTCLIQKLSLEALGRSGSRSIALTQIVHGNTLQ